MIKSVGQAMSAAVEASKLRETGKPKPETAVSREVSGVASEVAASPAARMAAQGAPIDTDRVARIKAAIAAGNYPVDAEKIADSMFDLDLPPRAKH
jgi:negative regulator of flagellin synthesis FlgM